MPILQINKLNFSYKKRGKPILNDITANFNRGEITAVAGASGAGKTTFLMLVSAMDKKYGGEILFNGNNIKNLDQNKYRAQNIGVVFQSYNLLFQANAVDNVMVALYLAKHTGSLKSTACQLLSEVGIDDEKQKRKCLHLSGGEQQRVAIARAFAGNPDIIIADEPTGNLDNANQEIILNYFIKLAKEKNKCVIIATHSDEVMKMADNVIRF